jgi:hypothetical protein
MVVPGSWVQRLAVAWTGSESTKQKKLIFEEEQQALIIVQMARRLGVCVRPVEPLRKR